MIRLLIIFPIYHFDGTLSSLLLYDNLGWCVFLAHRSKLMFTGENEPMLGECSFLSKWIQKGFANLEYLKEFG